MCLVQSVLLRTENFPQTIAFVGGCWLARGRKENLPQKNKKILCWPARHCFCFCDRQKTNTSRTVTKVLFEWRHCQSTESWDFCARRLYILQTRNDKRNPFDKNSEWQILWLLTKQQLLAIVKNVSFAELRSINDVHWGKSNQSKDSQCYSGHHSLLVAACRSHLVAALSKDASTWE